MECIDFTKSINLASSLGRTTPNLREHYIVKYTVSLPEVKKFVNLLSGQQRQCYDKLMKKVFADFDFNVIKWYAHNYEFTKRGKVHIHGYMYFDKSRLRVISQTGLINDFAKILCANVRKLLHRKTTSYKPEYMFDTKTGIFYKSPLCHLEFINNTKEYEHWISYMYKTMHVS